MAIRLITGRLQQGSRYCAEEQQILQKTTQEDRLTDQR